MATTINISERKKTKRTKLNSKGKRDIFMHNILNRRIYIPFESIGSNIQENLLKILKKNLEGKCSKEGYIKLNSIQIDNYSSGLIEGKNVIFDVVFNCEICHPVEGMLIDCRVLNITKAGIRAESIKDQISPIVVFVARDHHYKSDDFSTIKEDDHIEIRVIGIRYELNDDKIAILAKFIKIKPQK